MPLLGHMPLGAIAGCRCWVPLLGVQVGGLDVVTLRDDHSVILTGFQIGEQKSFDQGLRFMFAALVVGQRNAILLVGQVAYFHSQG